MRYRYTVIYSWFRWRRSGTRSYIADLVDCRFWLLGGSHLLKRLDKMAIICYNRGRDRGRVSAIPDHTLPIWYQITHYLLVLEHVRACVRPRAPARYTPVRTHMRRASWKPRRAGRELEAANAVASWTRAGKFDTSWKMCYNKAVNKREELLL